MQVVDFVGNVARKASKILGQIMMSTDALDNIIIAR
jgi:hypothetical protein